MVERRDGIKRLNHPLVGRFDIRYEALAVTGEADQALFIYITEPGSGSQSKLRTTAGWVYGDRTALEHFEAPASCSDSQEPSPNPDKTK